MYISIHVCEKGLVCTTQVMSILYCILVVRVYFTALVLRAMRAFMYHITLTPHPRRLQDRDRTGCGQRVAIELNSGYVSGNASTV